MRALLRSGSLALLLASGCRAEPAGPTAGPSPAPGDATTCSVSLETEAREALSAAGHPGAVIVIDLAREQEIVAVHEGIDPDHAIHPASTVKPFLAHAALERGLVEANELIACTEIWERDDTRLHCFAEHGAIDMQTALATSCNAYFYELASRLGVEGVAAAFRRVGLDAVATAAEEAPDLGSVITLAIGHGEARVTPRALARAHARLAREQGPHAEPVRAGMRDAVTDEHGTARAATVAALDIVGKTGTADGERKGHLHAWFAGYAPADDPRVLVLAYLDADGAGGEEAAPVAGRIFTAWRDRCGAPAPATLDP